MPNHKIHIIFSTTAGDLEDDFPLNQPLHTLKREVMARLKLDPSRAGDFVVTLSGNILDENRTLGDLAVPVNAVLIIERREVVKI
jgi:hypothetical protein